jgi:hypothetical protein
VVQPLDRRLDHAHLLLVAAWAMGDQRAVLLAGLEPEVLQETCCDIEVRHFQRVMVQP